MRFRGALWLLLSCPLGVLGACSNGSSTAADGSNTGGTGGAGGTGAGSRPADGSSASIASFLSGRAYESPPWVAETPEPRESGMGSASPHERVRVYFNEVLVQSLAAGNGTLDPPLAHVAGSMAVKVMYDSTASQVGIAALLKLEGRLEQMAYYCEGPYDRCATNEGPFTAAAPIYGVSVDVPCGFCHAGVVFSRPPN